MGYGFGRFNNYKLIIEPVFRFGDNNTFNLLSNSYYYRHEDEEYKSSVRFCSFYPTEYQGIWLDILSTRNYSYDDGVSSQDKVRVNLDFFNPTEVEIDAELVIVTEFSFLEGTYFFISDEPSYPGFQESYHGFHIKLPPGYWIQNVPIFELEMNQVGDSVGNFFWDWYAVLLDPETGELISNLSTSRTLYQY